MLNLSYSFDLKNAKKVFLKTASGMKRLQENLLFYLKVTKMMAIFYCLGNYKKDIFH